MGSSEFKIKQRGKKKVILLPRNIDSDEANADWLKKLRTKRTEASKSKPVKK